jgi:hypothetical protein
MFGSAVNPPPIWVRRSASIVYYLHAKIRRIRSCRSLRPRDPDGTGRSTIAGGARWPGRTLGTRVAFRPRWSRRSGLSFEAAAMCQIGENRNSVAIRIQDPHQHQPSCKVWLTRHPSQCNIRSTRAAYVMRRDLKRYTTAQRRILRPPPLFSLFICRIVRGEKI